MDYTYILLTQHCSSLSKHKCSLKRTTTIKDQLEDCELANGLKYRGSESVCINCPDTCMDFVVFIPHLLI